MNPLIAVHRKCYFLPAGWINEVVVSNISSKPSIYGYCCISYFASRDRQHALREKSFVWFCFSIIINAFALALPSWATAANFLISSTVSVKATTTKIASFEPEFVFFPKHTVHVHVKKQIWAKLDKMKIRLVTVGCKSKNWKHSILPNGLTPTYMYMHTCTQSVQAEHKRHMWRLQIECLLLPSSPSLNVRRPHLASPDRSRYSDPDWAGY